MSEDEPHRYIQRPINTNTFETNTKRKKEIRTFAFERLKVKVYPKDADEDFDDERNKNFCV